MQRLEFMGRRLDCQKESESHPMTPCAPNSSSHPNSSTLFLGPSDRINGIPSTSFEGHRIWEQKESDWPHCGVQDFSRLLRISNFGPNFGLKFSSLLEVHSMDNVCAKQFLSTSLWRPISSLCWWRRSVLIISSQSSTEPNFQNDSHSNLNRN